uniref:Ribosomal protein L16 n=1 Tax=Ancoracysta twista TaxID=2044563 RepID=A0A2H4R8H4_9EUKA|nr:ribosomal protein L16 [Ancoracysta twista]ATY40952.1 ribosomal protein L16 [Ancoracysta twista]
MYQPKNTKFRKFQKGRNAGITNMQIAYESYAIRAQEPKRVTARQIEATRRAIVRKTKRLGKLIIRIYPHKPVTSKAVGVRMGKGKGTTDYWCAPVKAGAILFELGRVPESLAMEALRLGMAKLPLKTIILKKVDFLTKTK